MTVTVTLDDYLARRRLPVDLADRLETTRRALARQHGGDLGEDGLRMKAWQAVVADKGVAHGG